MTRDELREAVARAIRDSVTSPPRKEAADAMADAALAAIEAAGFRIIEPQATMDPEKFWRNYPPGE